MIAIINKGKVKNQNKYNDRCEYYVQINKEFITKFEHNRSEGLARCLSLASEAVLIKNAKDNFDFIAELAKKDTSKDEYPEDNDSFDSILHR